MTEGEKQQLRQIVDLLYKDNPGKQKGFEEGWSRMTHQERKETWDKIQQMLKEAREKPADKQKKDGEKNPPVPEEQTSNAAPAFLRVTVPPDSRLSIGGWFAGFTSGTKLFITPRLARGRDFTYTLKVEILREGSSFALEREVTVRAGLRAEVRFEEAELIASVRR